MTVGAPIVAHLSCFKENCYSSDAMVFASLLNSTLLSLGIQTLDLLFMLLAMLALLGLGRRKQLGMLMGATLLLMSDLDSGRGSIWSAKCSGLSPR